MQPVPWPAGPLHYFEQANVRIANIAQECCSFAIAKVAISGPSADLIMALRRHLPSGPKAFLVSLALSDESR
jgi:hypothetical protein